MKRLEIEVQSLIDVATVARSVDWFWNISSAFGSTTLDGAFGGGNIRSDCPAALRRVTVKKEGVGLARMVARYLGTRLEKKKDIQCHDWRNELSDSDAKCEPFH